MGNETYASVLHGPSGEITHTNETYAELDKQRRERLERSEKQGAEGGSGLISDQFKVRSGSNVTRVTFGPDGAQAHVENVASASSMDRPNITADYSVVSTGRDSTSGRPLAPAELTPESVVNVGGIETSVKVAMSMGMIRPAPGGAGFEDVTAPDNASPQTQPQKEQKGQISMGPYDESETLPNGNASNFFHVLTENLPPEEMKKTVDEVVQSGTLSDKSVNRIADTLNLSTEDAQKELSQLADAYNQQRSKALADKGITGETYEIFSEFLQYKKEKDQSALRKQMSNGNLNEFREIGRAHV